jgi:pimeloyl-ACP methyl ester carboxylesterase
VRSLSLLSVSVLPGLTWHAHYYLQRLATPCSQARILANCARSLWGPTSPYSIKSLVSLLEKDLLLSPSPHSLYHVAQLEPVELSVPTFVGMGDRDFVISPAVSQLWTERLQSDDRSCDRLRHCPEGSHFFHTMFPEWVAEQLTQFWQQQEQAGEGSRPQRIGFKVPQNWGI